MGVVEAVGTAVGRSLPSPARERVEEAMRDAVAQAHAEGVRDPEKIRERILKARDAALGE